jgi:hypothetical protein
MKVVTIGLDLAKHVFQYSEGSMVREQSFMGLVWCGHRDRACCDCRNGKGFALATMDRLAIRRDSRLGGS